MPKELIVLLVGEALERSSPLKTLGLAIATKGVRFQAVGKSEINDTAQWIRQLRRCDCLVVVDYGMLQAYRIRQLALAALLGVPVIRWWVGTDVLTCVRNDGAGANAKTLDRIVARNIAVAPHLADELREIGIESSVIPSVIEGEAQANAALVPGADRAVLVYLPSERLQFYGESVIRRVAEENPDLRFVVVADETHALGNLPNVESRGWVDGLDQLWDKIGCLVRITEHDGLPRMVLDALRRGKFVVYSWPLPGCRLARSSDEVSIALREFRRVRLPIADSVEAARDLLTPDPSGRFVEMLRKVIKERSFRHRLSALLEVVRISIRARIQRRPGVTSRILPLIGNPRSNR